MTTPSSAPSALNRIAVYWDNPEHWADAARDVSVAGHVLRLTAPGVGDLVSVGVPLLFDAVARGEQDRLRHHFSDPAITEAVHGAKLFSESVPQSVNIDVVGMMPHGGIAGSDNFALRLRLQIHVNNRSGLTEVHQFWDVAQSPVTTTQVAHCPNCGAPPGPGDAFCHYCGAPVTATGDSAMLVTRLQLY